MTNALNDKGAVNDKEVSDAAPSHPELAGLSREQIRELFELAYSIALAITKSRLKADELVQSTFERLLTTRRWSGKQPLEVHVAGIVRGVAGTEHRSRREARAIEAHKGFHREMIGEHIPSPEELALQMEEQRDRDEHAVSELQALATKVAANPMAGRVLEKQRDGLMKSADIANALGVKVQQVYRAKEVLKRKLRDLRKNSNQPEAQETRDVSTHPE